MIRESQINAALLRESYGQSVMKKGVAEAERPRKRYRIRNRREYDRGLIARGDLTVWLSPDLAWHAPQGTRKRGRPLVFSDAAVQCVLTQKVLFQLPLRAAQGLVGSPLRLMGLAWPVPHDSTLSRAGRDPHGRALTSPHEEVRAGF
jgi:hypothetical protein